MSHTVHPDWTAIAAVAENGVIGNGLDIPWHLPEDFKWFKKTTLGHRLLMGRKTYESIGRPLPGRETLVLSRSAHSYEGVRLIPDLETLHQLPPDPRKLFICGGAEIYRQCLPHCAELLLTRVHMNPEGDIVFPAFEKHFTEHNVIQENTEFTIYRFTRITHT